MQKFHHISAYFIIFLYLMNCINSIHLLVLNVGNGWVAGGCWDDEIDS